MHISQLRGPHNPRRNTVMSWILHLTSSLPPQQGTSPCVLGVWKSNEESRAFEGLYDYGNVCIKIFLNWPDHLEDSSVPHSKMSFSPHEQQAHPSRAGIQRTQREGLMPDMVDKGLPISFTYGLFQDGNSPAGCLPGGASLIFRNGSDSPFFRHH